MKNKMDDVRLTLSRTDLKNTKEFSLSGYEGWARLVDCYDGDTVKLLLPVGAEQYVFSCRLLGVNAPELKNADVEGHKNALASRNHLIEWCMQQSLPQDCTPKEIRSLLQSTVCLLWVRCFQFEKYGRVLVELKNTPEDTETLNKQLVREGYAIAYLEKK